MVELEKILIEIPCETHPDDKLVLSLETCNGTVMVVAAMGGNDIHLSSHGIGQLVTVLQDTKLAMVKGQLKNLLER